MRSRLIVGVAAGIACLLLSAPTAADAASPTLGAQGDNVAGHSLTLTYSNDDPQLCAGSSTVVFYWDWSGGTGTNVGSATMDGSTCTATWTGTALSDAPAGDHAVAADVEPDVNGVPSLATATYTIDAATVQLAPSHGPISDPISVTYTYPGSSCPSARVDLTWQQGNLGPEVLGQQSLNGCTAQWTVTPPPDGTTGSAALRAVALAADSTQDNATAATATYTVDISDNSALTPTPLSGSGSDAQTERATPSSDPSVATQTARPGPSDSSAAVATTADGLGPADIAVLRSLQPVSASGFDTALTIWPLLLLVNVLAVLWIARSIRWRRRFVARIRGERP